MVNHAFRFCMTVLVLAGLNHELLGEELRSVGYDLARYTVDRRYDPEQRPEKLRLIPTTRISIYDDLGKLRLAMHFYPEFDETNQATVTYVEKLGSGVDMGFYILSAPVRFADEYLTLLKAGKVKRIDGTYDRAQPQGSSTIKFAATKFKLLLESR